MFAFMNPLFTITSLASLVLSLPVNLRDVVDPPITSPTAGTVWHVGEKQLVTWSTEGLPANITNPVGMLVLGYNYNNSENLMLNSPLATNINYTDGQVLITVPNVETREDYIVVLFGDSGNASPEFTIINDSSSSSAPPPSTSSSVQTATTPTGTAPPTGSASPISQAPSKTPTSTLANLTPTTSGITSAGGASKPTLSSSTTSVVTSTVGPTQATLTGGAWKNHASGASIILALLSLLYIM